MAKRPATEGATNVSAKQIKNWNTNDVASWLAVNGFSQYVKLFTEQHKINGEVLLLITEDDLRLPPLSITILGDIKRLALALKVLTHDGRRADNVNQDLVDSTVGFTDKGRVCQRFPSVESEDDGLTSVPECVLPNGHMTHASPSASSSSYSRSRVSRELKAEPVKLLISFCYMFFVFMLTAFTMVIVHDRVPDMNRYPPLPDIVLDNLPYISWAFEACEATAVILAFILLSTLIFHKHRFIILRRIFALTGTVFMLRCVTMLITSLSVPGTHLMCEPKNFGDFPSKLRRAFVIWTGFGMSLQGVRTCGDYMFSGHTVIVTLVNFFITEYTPRRIPMLHTASWIMNIFAIFFILAAHEHYSIDVFVAFYLTSRLFLYYHSLSNNRVLQQPDHVRTKTWFPMFSYFESSIDGVVPNEFESPITAIMRCWPVGLFKRNIENLTATSSTPKGTAIGSGKRSKQKKKF